MKRPVCRRCGRLMVIDFDDDNPSSVFWNCDGAATSKEEFAKYWVSLDKTQKDYLLYDAREREK